MTIQMRMTSQACYKAGCTPRVATREDIALSMFGVARHRTSHEASKRDARDAKRENQTSFGSLCTTCDESDTRLHQTDPEPRSRFSL